MPRAAATSTKCQYASALKKYWVIAEFGARVDLALEVVEVVLRRARLRVDLGIGGDVDVEPVAGLARG